MPSGPGHRSGAPSGGAQPRAPLRSTCGVCPLAQGTAPGRPRAVPSPGHRSGAHVGGSGAIPGGVQPRAPLPSTCGGVPHTVRNQTVRMTEKNMWRSPGIPSGPWGFKGEHLAVFQA